MTQEALKLSQEALAGLKDVKKQVRELIAENKALKETLAQTEREYERGFIDGMQKQMQSSVDKAVNAMSQTERPADCERCNRLEEQAYDLVGKLRVANIKLSMQPQRTWVGSGDLEDSNAYLTPPQRTWVGLTDEEICTFSMWLDDKSDVTVFTAIEAKLKEKNP